MAAILVLLMAVVALVWMHAPPPQPVKVRRNLLEEELLASYVNRYQR